MIGKEMNRYYNFLVFQFQGSMKVFLILMHFRPFQEETQEEQLLIVDRKVLWSASGSLKSSFCLPHKVIACVWTNFEENQYLCLVHEEALQLYSISGKVFSVPLPCKIDNIWSISNGIILERQKKEGSEEEEPIIFSLTHPLEEIKPISYMQSNNTIRFLHLQKSRETFFVCDPAEKIVFTSIPLELMILYNNNSKKHSFWKLHFIPKKIISDVTQNIESEIFIDFIYLENDSSSIGTNVFISFDSDFSILICILKKNDKKLEVFRYVEEKIIPSFCIPAISAIPISFTRRNQELNNHKQVINDILILEHSGILTIYIGKYKLYQHTPKFSQVNNILYILILNTFLGKRNYSKFITCSFK
jgi:hypothetical protein